VVLVTQGLGARTRAMVLRRQRIILVRGGGSGGGSRGRGVGPLTDAEPRVTETVFGGGTTSRVEVEHREKEVSELDSVSVRPLVARRQQFDERLRLQIHVDAKMS